MWTAVQHRHARPGDPQTRGAQYAFEVCGVRHSPHPDAFPLNKSRNGVARSAGYEPEMDRRVDAGTGPVPEDQV